MKVQRLRFRYRLRHEALGLGHRDIVTAWEDAAKAAGLAVSHSEGKRPAPQISLAAPLPQGVTSDCEYLDIYLASRAEPVQALKGIAAALPSGLQAIDVREVGVGAASVQTVLRWAEYEVDVPADELSEDDVRRAIECMLSAATVPAEYRRETKVRSYDIRPLVLDVQLLGRTDGVFHLCMRLRAEQDNTARADQIVLALGLPEPVCVHRKWLALEELPAVIQAYRRAGERDG